MVGVIDAASNEVGGEEVLNPESYVEVYGVERSSRVVRGFISSRKGGGLGRR